MILKAYCGQISDESKVKQCASGGLATAMAEKTTSDGNIVYGVAYTSDFKNAEYIRVENIDQVTKLRGSKYIKAPVTKEILQSIAKDLSDCRVVLFIGLPCDVAAVKAYLEKNNINQSTLVCVDLICHGPTSSKVSQEYISRLEKKYKSKVIALSVRYKNPYWIPPFLYVGFENGKEYIEDFYATDYGIAFKMMPRKTCFSCIYKNDNYKSDITIGDYWGTKEGDDGYNKFGSSVGIVYTDKGDKFINSLDNFNLFNADLEKTLEVNKRYFTPTQNTPLKETFRQNYEKKGLSYAVFKYLSLRENIRRRIPQKLVLAVRKLKGTK